MAGLSGRPGGRQDFRRGNPWGNFSLSQRKQAEKKITRTHLTKVFKRLGRGLHWGEGGGGTPAPQKQGGDNRKITGGARSPRKKARDIRQSDRGRGRGCADWFLVVFGSRAFSGPENEGKNFGGFQGRPNPAPKPGCSTGGGGCGCATEKGSEPKTKLTLGLFRGSYTTHGTRGKKKRRKR